MELAWQEQRPEPSKLQRWLAWLIKRFMVRNERETFMSRIATGSMALFGSIVMFIAVLGMPTGLGTLIDSLLFLTINAAALSISTIILSFIFSLLYIPLPRRFLASWLYVGVLTYFILYFAELGIFLSIFLSFVYIMIATIAGGVLGILLALRIKARSKGIIASVLVCVVSVSVVCINWIEPVALPHRTNMEDRHTESLIQPLMASNPADPGTFRFETFSYGSGKDKHRAKFGDKVDLQTTAVDASNYITKWSRIKTLFWGFDEHELPLNGRVWMPVGEGSFPITLIVHGNHLMEDFSDSGYNYLGELLASQGIIAVSVDENFLNYSVWSGIPNNDMKVRAWILLKHLQQIKLLNEQDGNRFSAKVDMSNVAMIGHSRGGQAVAMAADPDKWFKEDKTLDDLEEMNIESVIAIAPTDKQVDDESAHLRDVNYLSLQGSRDADVNIFYGDRQYNRTSFGTQSDQFKATLYIGDANHSQFNTAWGTMDERPPGGLFLNAEGMLEEEEQRQISKVYVAAFLRATLLGQHEYRPLFYDYRNGREWLPETDYMNRYENAHFVEITRYEDEHHKTTLTTGGTAEAAGMTTWEKRNFEDRDGRSKGTKGIELEWADPGASYKLELADTFNTMASDELKEDGNFVFSMANLEYDLISEASVDIDGMAESNSLHTPLPQVKLTFTTNDGDTGSIELDEVLPVSSAMYSAFTKSAWLEKRIKDEKYKASAEAVFQTYIIPIEKLDFRNESITADDISEISFHFLNSPGKVMIDDIGFMPY